MRAAVLLFLLALSATAQLLDWPFAGGDAQRSGWRKSDVRITKENAKDFELVLKRKLEPAGGTLSLTPPVIIGNLISYKGFKELGFVQGNSGQLWAIDLDLDRLFWKKQLATKDAGCSGSAMAIPTLTPPIDFSAARPRPAGAAPKPSVLGSNAFGSPRPAFALSKDGQLHVLNTSTGEDLVEPIAFLPAKRRASDLAIADGAIYTAATDCAGKAGAVFAIDMDADDRPVTSYAVATGVSGIAIGRGGTVYAAAGDGSLVGLSQKTLTAKSRGQIKGPATAPVVFNFKGREMVAVAGASQLALFDGEHLELPVATVPLAGAASGGISTWVDAEDSRWLAVPSAGVLATFKVGDSALTPSWVSKKMTAPEAPVIAAGVVFVLDAGGSRAVLHALDAATGDELYSSKEQVTAPANRNGLSIANGRVFFTTADGTLYGFGIHLDVLGSD